MPDSQVNIAAALGSAWHVNSTKFTEQVGYISGSGSPVSAQTPLFIGQEYFDSTNNNWWIAYGTASADWVQIGGQTDNLGATTITAASAAALAVGANGTTNPVLTINSATTSVATGVSITGAAAGSGVAEQVTSSGTNENLTVNAKGSGTISLNNTTSTGALILNGGGGGVQVGAGSATVAPLTLTSGTLTTAAAAGAIEFDGANFYATAVASSRQAIDAEQYQILAANYVPGSVTSAAFQALNGTTNGEIGLVAGKQYAFEALYVMTDTGTTSHTWSVLFGLNNSLTLTSILYNIFSQTGTSAAPASGSLTGYATAATAVVVTAALTNASDVVMIQLAGTLVVNVAGNLQPQLKASATPGGTQTILPGSFFRIWELGPASVGDWT
jgi:hypothetical protein